MRVYREGMMAYKDGTLTFTGWGFDMEGAPYPSDAQQAGCALAFVAAKCGAELPAAEHQTAPLRVEREAANIIRNAKQAAKPKTKRTGWKKALGWI